MTPEQTRSNDARIEPRWLLLLSLFIGLQPISVDLSLPALPRLADAFQATPAQVQLTLSVFIGAFAIAQLVVGPLSDRFGRRPVCLTGLVLCSLGGLLATLAPTLDILIAARLTQSLGVCTVVVCARAIVRDRYEPVAGAQVLSKVMSWMTLAPFSSPIIGGLALEIWGWRACFAIMALASVLALVFCWRWQFETNHWRNPQATRPSTLAGTYWMLIRSRELLSFMLMLVGSFSAMFSFISGSSYLLTRVHGLSATAYGLSFAAVTLGFLLGTILLRRLTPRGGLRRVLAIGAGCSLTGGSLLLAGAWAGLHSVAAILLPVFLMMIGHGLIQPACQTGSAAPFPAHAGSAVALVGFVMNITAAAVGFLLASRLDGTVLPMAESMFCSTLVVALTYLLMVRPLLKSRPDLAGGSATATTEHLRTGQQARSHSSHSSHSSRETPP